MGPASSAVRHDHQGHARLRVTGEDGAGDGRRPAVPGQQGWVNIQRRTLGHGQEVGRDQLAIGGEQDPVRRECAQRRAALVGAEAGRGDEDHPPLAGERADGRGTRLQASSGGPIGCRHDEQVVGKLRQTGEQRDGERPGTEEGDAADGGH